jgi:Mce-associated membrane protein
MSVRSTGTVGMAEADVDAGADTERASVLTKSSPVTRVVDALKAAPSAASARFYRIYDDVVDRPVRAVRILGIVVLAVAVLTGLFWFQDRRYEQTAEARTAAMSTAASSVVKLLSYNFRTIDRQVSDTQGMITGKFKDDYAALVNNTVAPTAKDKQIAVQTAIADNGVVSSSAGQVVLLMFVNQQSESLLKPNAVLTGSRIRVTMQNEQGKWLISELTPV